MNKYAYLIQAHNNINIFKELILNLSSNSDCDIYVHIDKKFDINPFKKIMLENNLLNNVFFIEDRVNIKWMGFSQVEASINLMKEAIKNKKYKYISLLSGVDFPIQNLSSFHTFLDKNNDKEYISFWELNDRPDWLHKIQHYYPIDFIEIRNWKKNILRLLFWGTFFAIRKFLPKRKFIPELIPFGGSSWWTLTNNAVEYILSIYKERKDIVKYYKYTHAPDEMFFQTILLNSKYRKQVFMINEYNKWQAQIKDTSMLDEKLFNLRYIDWSGREDQYPVILDERDYQTLLDSNCFFARKFSEEKSNLLIEMLKKHINS